MRLKELIEIGALPKEVVPLSNYARDCITISEYNKLDDNKRLNNTTNVICDNPSWVAINNHNGQVFSYDGKYVYKCIAQGKDLAKQELTGNNKLATVQLISLRTPKNKSTQKERNVMEIKGDFSLDSLSKQLENNAQAGAPEETGKPLTAFTEGSAETVLDTVSANIEGIKQADAGALRAFNRELGEFVGYITNAEAVVKISAASKPIVGEDGKTKQLIPGAPADMVALHAQGKKVPGQYYAKESVLKAKQAAPGAIIGTVIGIPLGGLAPISELRGSGVVTPGQDKTLKYMVYDKDTSYSIISLYFGSRIRESKKTHGEQAQYLNFVLKYGTKKSKEDGAPIAVVKPQLKPDSRKSLLLPGNYFPVKVYKTINVTKALTQEEADLANLSTFIHLFTPVASREPKVRNLRAEDRNKIAQEGNKITSKFFTTNLQGRENLTIPTFYDKNKNIEVLNIPVKKAVPKADKSGVIYRYDVINCLDAKQMAKPEERAKSSLYGDAYRNFLEACNGAVTAESLKSLTRSRDKKGNKGADIVSDETARGLLLAQMDRGLTDLVFEGTKKRTSFDELSEKIAAARG